MQAPKKDILKGQIRRYRDIHELIRDHENKLDKGLTPAARTTRALEYAGKFESELLALKRDLQAGQEYYQDRRELLSQPLRALLMASLAKSDTVNPGMAVSCQNMALLGEAGLLGIMGEPCHPAVLLTACNLVAASIPEGRNVQDSKVLNSAIASCARQFVDQAAIKACAELELEIFRVLAEYASRNGSGHARIATALKVEQLEQVLNPRTEADPMPDTVELDRMFA